MEQSFLAWLKGRQHGLPQVAVGIGDDAAVLDWPQGQLVAANDGIVDGVDFLTDRHPLDAIGRKAIAINLSDMAAMGAVPVACLVNLCLPQQHATQTAAGIYEGILAIAAQFQLAIAGGDLTVYDGPLAIDVTILGRVAPGTAWLRSGAQVGDAIFVTGALGGSILGRHLAFQPRVTEAIRLRETVAVRAAIDVSDGLSLDLDRLCAASGVGAELNLATIPIAEDAYRLGDTDGGMPLQHALGDGEDFELIVAVPKEQVRAAEAADLGCPLTQIGWFTGRTGLWSRQAGQVQRLLPAGYVHGRSR